MCVYIYIFVWKIYCLFSVSLSLFRIYGISHVNCSGSFLNTLTLYGIVFGPVLKIELPFSWENYTFSTW